MALGDKIIKNPSEKIRYKAEGKEAKYSQSDLEYMSSLSSAVLLRSSASTRIVLWSFTLLVLWLLAWAGIAEIDELTRGAGKVIPSGQVQVVQNLEGGIVSEIMVEEGEIVHKGQPLLKIHDVKFVSSLEESKINYFELKAKAARLQAEAHDTPMEPLKEKDPQAKTLYRQERSLYLSNKKQLEQSLAAIDEQLKQKQSELEEANAKIREQTEAYKYILKELKITEPLVKKGVVSQVEYLKLKREANAIGGELKGTKLSIPRMEAAIQEIREKRKEANLVFRNKAKEQLNETLAELSRIQESQQDLEDKVSRTVVRSPVEGTIKQMLVNTIGGVVRPGDDLVEIVPLEDSLVAEVKIRPSDIAFLYPGQEAMVKFTAYDFAIHGGLKGRVQLVSADTITDEKGESYYTVRIVTDKNYLGSKEAPLKIMVGMTVNVDILTGKKTVLQYLLKPILRAKESALRER